MNEEAFNYSYDLFKKDGYTGSIDDYKSLIASDKEALDYSYQLFQKDGYKGKLEDYSSLIGLSNPQATQEQQPAQEQPIEKVPANGIAEFVANINQTALNIPADIADAWSIASAFTERQLAKLGVPGANPNVGAKDVGAGIPYSKITDEYRNIVKELAPVSDEFKETFAGGVSQGLGQVLGMALSGGGSKATEIAKMTKSVGGSLTPIVSAGKELLKNVGSRQGLIGGSMNASANYKQAIDDGATEEQALKYGIENMVVGSVMENLPIQSMFSRISKMEPGAKILDVVKNGLVGAGEEAVTEGFQTTYENMSAERIYDLQKNMLDGVGDAAAVGGTVGFILNSALSALTGRRAKIKSPEEAEVLDKAIEETQDKIETVEQNNKKIEETVTALENTKERTLNDGVTDLAFIENPDGSIELTEDGLSAPDAQAKKLLLETKYPNVEFQVVDNTDKSDPYAESDFTVIGRPKSNAKYSKGGESLSKNQAEFLIEGATTLDELEGLSIDNDPDLQSVLQTKVAGLAPKSEPKADPTISDMGGESVSVRIGDQNISGIVEVDEGGKATISQGGRIYEIPQDAQFSEFVRPVEVSPEGDFVVNGDSFSEARIVTENGEPKALLVRPDGTTKAITNPRIVEEIEYQITLSQLDQMSDQEADKILKTYEEQRQTEATTEKGAVESNETEDERRLREATEEIQLIEDLAIMELEDIESQAKLVEFTPPTMKEAKVYLVKKNPDGSYSATLNGRKVARPEIVAELGKSFDQKTGEDISKLQEQTNKLKQEVEQKLFPDAKRVTKQSSTTEQGGKGQDSPKAVSQKPTNKGIDTKVPLKQNGKTEQSTTPSQSAKEKSAGRPKKGTGKGRVPLDERKLRGKEAEASKLTPNTIEESVLSWFVNKGRLSYGGLQSVFGQQKQGGKKSIQGEFNARRSFMRTPEKGGKSVEEIVDEIYNNLPESLTEKADSNPTAIKSAIENAIIENSSVAQMAEKLLSGRGVDSKASRPLPPIEERTTFPDDAIRQSFTPEEQAVLTPQEKADFFNEYFQYPKGSEYEYTPEMVQELDGENVDQDEFENDIDFLSVMSDEELIEFEKNYKGVEEEFAPKKASNPVAAQRQKVKDLANDLLSQIKEDKQGIIIDFEQKAKDDIKFFNTLRNLVIEYARLKGLQFNEFITDLQKLLGQKIEKKDREYLKSIWDAEKKATPRKNVMTENQSMSYKDQVKQGLEEILASRARVAQIRLDRAIQKGREEVQKAKDKGAEKLAQFKNIRTTMVEFIKMDLKDIPVSEFTKGELTRILGKIEKANTDWSLNKAISEAYQIIGEAGVKKRLRDADSKRKAARVNIKAGKIGQLEKNSNLDSMLKIAPKLIPERVFDSYEKIVEDLGARKKVLSPIERSQLESNAAAIMKGVDNDNSRAQSLKIDYDNFQDKKETFGKTIDQMVKDSIIDQDDRDFMMDRKSEIEEKEASAGSGMDQDSVDELIRDVISAKSGLPQSGSLFTTEENNIIRFFNSITKGDLQALLKPKEVNGETLYEASYVKNILGLMQNIKDGYIPHLAESTRQTVEANRTVAIIKPIVAGYKGNWTEWVSGLKAAVKNRNQKGTSTLQEKLRRSPIYAIDLMLGNFKNSDFYQNTFRKVGLALSNKDSDTNRAVARIDAKLSKIPENDQWEQLSIIRMIQLQKQHESNLELPSTKAWLDATLTEDGVYLKGSEDSLRDIFDRNSTNGELDVKKAERNLSPAAKDLMDEITNIQDSELKPKVDFGATVVHGKRVPLPDNYAPTPTKYSPGSKAEAQKDALRQKVNTRSARAGTFEEKTKVAHPISFDPVESFYWSMEETLTDFYMTPVIKELDQAMNTLYLSSEGKTKESARAIRNVYEEVIKSVLGAERLNSDQTAFSQKALNFIEKKGYQAMLGGIVRPSIDLASNLTYAGLYKAKESILGTKIMIAGLKNPGMLAKVVKNIGSTELNRMYDTVGISNRFADSGKKEQRAPLRRPKNNLEKALSSAKVSPVLKNAYEGIDYLADQSVSTPDKIVSRMIFLGEFTAQFKSIAGKDPDFQKIADGDQDYIEENHEAIKKAGLEGDKQINEAFSSSNQAGGILRNNKKASTNGFAAWLSAWQGFMTKFTTGEYITALKAVNAMMGNGEISRAKGARLLSAQMARISIYSFLIQKTAFAASGMVLGLLGFEPPEEEKEEKNTTGNDLAQSIAQVFFTIAIQRNFGNWAKIPIDYFTEFVNSKFGEGITYSGEYNAFDDSIAFPIFDPSRNLNPRESALEKIVVKTAGPASPMAKAAIDFSNNYRLMEASTKPETIEKYERRIWMNMMQLVGSVGGVPFYRDVNHAWKQELRKKEQNEKDGKTTKAETKSKFDYR